MKEGTITLTLTEMQTLQSALSIMATRCIQTDEQTSVQALRDRIFNEWTEFAEEIVT